MTGDESAWMWSIGLIAFSFGLATGFVLHYVLNSGTGRSKELEAELEKLKEETTQYRQDVSTHFQRTSELVQGMTQSYRSVYEHLATGSQKLCGDQIRTPLLDFPEPPSLRNDAEAAEKTTASDDEAENGEQAPPIIPPQESADHDDYLGDAPYVPDLTPVPPRSTNKVD